MRASRLTARLMSSEVEACRAKHRLACAAWVLATHGEYLAHRPKRDSDNPAERRVHFTLELPAMNGDLAPRKKVAVAVVEGCSIGVQDCEI